MFTTAPNAFVQSLENRRLMSATIKPVAQPMEELPLRNEVIAEAPVTSLSASPIVRSPLHAIDLTLSDVMVSDHNVSDL